MKRKLNRKAFTLVELLVVIAILAILATVAVVGYTAYIKNAYVSNDRLVATDLSHALQAYSVEHDIKTEADLKKAIEYFAGRDYLAKLAPQSAEHGYHFWYDIESEEIIIARPDEVGVATVGFRPFFAAHADGDPVSPFAPNSVRVFKGNDGKFYYLLDRVNEHSEVVGLINKLENPYTKQEDYESARDEAKTKGDALDKKLIEELDKSLNNIVILNQAGSITNTKNPVYIYIPDAQDKEDGSKETYTVIGDSSINLSGVKGDITLPEGVKADTGSLKGLPNDVVINVSTDNKPAGTTDDQYVSDCFHQGAVGSNTVIKTEKDEYKFVTDTDLQKKDENGNWGSTDTEIQETSIKVADFTISIEGIDSTNKFDIALDSVTDTDTYQMVADKFKSDNVHNPDHVPNKGVTWTCDAGTTGATFDNGLISGIKEAGTITVTATSKSNPSVVRTYIIRVGKIDDMSIKFQNATNSGNVQFDDGVADAIEHQIVSGGNNTFLFTFTPNYFYSDVTECDNSIDFDITGTDSDRTYEVSDDNKTVTVNFKKAGTYTVTVFYKEYPEVTRTFDVVVTNVVTSFKVGYKDGETYVTDKIYVDFNTLNGKTYDMDVFGTTSDGGSNIPDSRVNWKLDVKPADSSDVSKATIGTDGTFTPDVAGTYTVSAYVDGDESNTQTFILYVVKPLRPTIKFDHEVDVKVDGDEMTADHTFTLDADIEYKYALLVEVKYSSGDLGDLTPSIEIISGNDIATYDNGYLTFNKAGTIEVKITVEGHDELTTVLTITANNLVKDYNFTVNTTDKVVLSGDNTIVISPDFTGEFSIDSIFNFYHEGDTTAPDITWNVDGDAIKCLNEYGFGKTGRFNVVSSADTTITITATPEGHEAKTFTVVFAKLTGFELDFGDIGLNKGTSSTYLNQTSNSTTIYIAYNHAGEIVINPKDFAYEGGYSFTSEVDYAITGDAVTLNGNKLTVNSSATSLESTITVSAKCDPEIKQTFTVKIVKLTNAVIALAGNNVAAFKEYATSTGDNLTNNFEITYVKDFGSQALTISKLVYNHQDDEGNPYVSLGIDLSNLANNTFTTDGDYISIANNKLSLESSEGGSQFITLNVGNLVGQIEATVVNAFTNPLKLADNANTLGKYSLQLTLGNSNEIALGTLFSRIEGETIVGKNIVVNVYEGSTTATPTPLLNITADANWASQTIKLGNDISKAIIEVLVDGNKSIELPVTIVEGYNVVDPTSWSSASGKIVLLKDITTNTNKAITSIYGNYNTITTTYNVHNSNFITMSSGSMNELIIDGPVYPHLVFSAGTYTSGGFFGIGGTKYDTTYFCHGVVLSGSVSINNSYISGFRAPVRITSNTADVTFKNSVLEGGVYANLLVYQAKSITLNNTKLIQNINGYKASFTGADGSTKDKVIGAGVFVETNATNGFTFNIVGNTHIYTYLNKNTDYSIDSMNDYVDAFASKAKDYMHNTNYINMAFMQEKKKADTSFNIVQTESTDSSVLERTENIYASTKYFTIATYKHGDGCTCSNDITFTYSIDTFKTEQKTLNASK